MKSQETTPLDYFNALAAEVRREIAHIQQMVDQRFESQKILTEQKLEAHEKISQTELKGILEKVDDGLQETRGYKDILGQQLILLDKETKSAHARIDENSQQIETNSLFLSDLQKTLKKLQEIIDILQTAKKEAEIADKTRSNDPVRKFLSENGKKLLVFIAAGILFYLIRNLQSVLTFFQSRAG